MRPWRQCQRASRQQHTAKQSDNLTHLSYSLIAKKLKNKNWYRSASTQRLKSQFVTQKPSRDTCSCLKFLPIPHKSDFVFKFFHLASIRRLINRSPTRSARSLIQDQLHKRDESSDDFITCIHSFVAMSFFFVSHELQVMLLCGNFRFQKFSI